MLNEGIMPVYCESYGTYGVCVCVCVLSAGQPPGTQYTHHSLKHMLPQYCTTYNDVFLLITSKKV